MEKIIITFPQFLKRKSIPLILEKLVTMTVGLAVTVFLAREMSLGEFGLLNYLLASVAFIPIIGSLGLNSLVTKLLIEAHGEKDGEILSNVLNYRALFTVGVAFVICLLSLDASQAEGGQKALVVLAVASTFASADVFEFWFHSRNKFGQLALTRGSSYLISALVKIIVCVYSPTALSLSIAFGFEILLRVTIQLLVVSRSNVQLSFSHINVRKHFSIVSNSVWLMFSGVFAAIYLRIDQVMLGRLVGTEEVALYAVSSKITGIWFTFGTLLVIPIFTQLLKNKVKDQKLYEIFISENMTYLFYLGAVVGLLTFFAGPHLITLTFGNKFERSAEFLQISCLVLPLIYQRALVSKILIAESLFKFSLISHCAGAFINVILNLIAIPELGGKGAAIASVASYVLSIYFIFLLFKKTRWISIFLLKAIFQVRPIVDIVRTKVKGK